MVVSLLLAIHTGKAVQWIKAHPNFSIVVMAVMIAVPVTCALYLLIKEMDDDINQH